MSSPPDAPQPFPSGRDRPPQWPWRFFTPEELACPGSGQCAMEASFMDRLERLRIAFDQPMPISSGFRSPAWNRKVSTTGSDGPHTTGRAVDTRMCGDAAFRLVRLAMEHGFTGIGIGQHGPHARRFIHLDDLPADRTRPRPWLWSYGRTS